MFFKKLENYKVLLASGSKRRHELLNGLKVKFELISQEVDESYPEKLKKHEITDYLAKKKIYSIKKIIKKE